MCGGFEAPLSAYTGDCVLLKGDVSVGNEKAGVACYVKAGKLFWGLVGLLRITVLLDSD